MRRGYAHHSLADRVDDPEQNFRTWTLAASNPAEVLTA